MRVSSSCSPGAYNLRGGSFIMMKLMDVKSKAKQMGIINPSSDRMQLVRQIQTAEGFFPCFKTKDSCDQLECCWRNECLKK
jgi:hypothetical protein